MSDDKKPPVDPLAQTGFAEKPVDPLAQTGFAEKPVDPLAQTGFAQQIDPLAQTGFAAPSPASTAHGGMAGIDPLAQTSHGAPAGIDPLAQTAHRAAPVTAPPRPVEAPRPTPVPRRPSGLRWAVLAIVLVGAAVAAIVLASRSDHPKAAVAPAPTPTPTPAPAPAPATTVEALLDAQDKAIADGSSAPFQSLLAQDMWGIGIDASEVRFSADQNDELVRDVIGMQVQSFTKKRWTGHTADAAWAATVYTFADGHQVELTEAMTLHDGHWLIDAWHWSVPLSNRRAYELAQAGMLPKPADLPAGKAAPDPDIKAMLGDRAAYVAAVSPRDDAFAFGSAPGEVMVGGAAITRAFSHMDATFAVRSGPIVRHIADDLAFALANVDFTNKAGIQTFRVMIVLEHGTIVLAHWSNARAL